ncbi:FAD-dependent oxidoreductase [Secundilactobacillus paracollinoides]|uniref:FAD/NAD(P)-binding domain-containing protein n=1 Tax=Secundilactobacillus paracollinoides TaxID=240427 RepID=A0A1B2J0Z8_9LACO|nr:FAD-dependent oxidoreductase [Secundilactobacillus paracollinoides]ANZ62021.1 hypothetical protein AYR61_12110 [Secundilactobacillus paracollinoides]ANZ67967.1 hypothetical protein AYR63_13005 [Secundilactobacillus paracollinoides]
MTKIDVIVIGGGVGGTTVANGLAAKGREVAIVEERDWVAPRSTVAVLPRKPCWRLLKRIIS